MPALRKVPLCAAVSIAMTALPAVPSVAADPQQFPDLLGYTDVNAQGLPDLLGVLDLRARNVWGGPIHDGMLVARRPGLAPRFRRVTNWQLDILTEGHP